MKRPPGLWLLLSAGVLWLCFKDVSCVRGSALVFAKSTTSTTSTTIAPTTELLNSTLEETGVNATTKSPLTGNPQKDYVYDPNLPRELNGFNLTDYPFFSILPPPEEIAFKCDGLHDGFYASVAHQCQVYHHCVYGIRIDFLCANYTAFDQKTFICHFASEVDCANSKNFWHRNDALYEPTTTIKSLVVPHAALAPINRKSPLRSGQGGNAGGNAGGNGGGNGGNGRRRRPYRRRRPQYDYYDDEEEPLDDYYEEDTRYQATTEPPRRRTKRPRPRPRPVYDDEYDDYEDERFAHQRRGDKRNYDRRGSSDDRRGMDDRRYDERKRYKEDRRKYKDEDEEDVDQRFDRSEERKPASKDEGRRNSGSDDRGFGGHDDRRSSSSDEKRSNNDDRRSSSSSSDDKRSSNDDRRTSSSSEDKRFTNDDRRSNSGDRRSNSDDRRSSADDRRSNDDRRVNNDDRRSNSDDRRSNSSDDRRSNSSDDKRPVSDDRRSSSTDDRRSDKRRASGSDDRHEKRPDDSRRPAKTVDYYDDEPLPRDRDRKPLQSTERTVNKKQQLAEESSPRGRTKASSASSVKEAENDEPGVSRKIVDTPPEGVPLVKPSSGSSVYDRPRAVPRIRLPVPKSEQNKYSYKTSTLKPSSIKQLADEEEYYDDYEEELPPVKKPTPTPAPPPPPPIPRRNNNNNKPDSTASGDSRRNFKTQLDRNRDIAGHTGQSSSGGSRNGGTRTSAVESPEEDRPRRTSGNGSRSKNSAVEPDRKNKRPVIEYDDDYEAEELPPRGKSTNRDRVSYKDRKSLTNGSREDKDQDRQRSTSTTSTTTTTTTTETPTTVKEKPEPVVRVVKRPFLPSRGGSPFTGRGLQPVGSKALQQRTKSAQSNEGTTPEYLGEDIREETESRFRNSSPSKRDKKEEEDSTVEKAYEEEPPARSNKQQYTGAARDGYPGPMKHKAAETEPEEEYEDIVDDSKTIFKPSPVIVKVPSRTKYAPVKEVEEDFRPVSNRPQLQLRPNVYKMKDPRENDAIRNNNKGISPNYNNNNNNNNVPKQQQPQERNPLDITETEYDVTLNDALNPTLPNLPVRNFPTGFSASSDYTYSAFRRGAAQYTPQPPQQLDQQQLHTQSSEYKYRYKEPQQQQSRYEPQLASREQTQQGDHRGGQFVGVPYQGQGHQQHFRSSPRVTHAQTQAYYTTY